jgi:hypothetical protein
VHHAAPVRDLQRSGPAYSGAESAHYSQDMLAALESMAVQHAQHRLAQLLHQAKLEADRLAASQK